MILKWITRIKFLDIRNFLRWIRKRTRFNEAFASTHRLFLNKWISNRLSPSSPLSTFPTSIYSLIKTPTNFIWFILFTINTRIIKFMVTHSFIYSDMLKFTLFLFLLTKRNELVNVHLSLFISLFLILFIFLIQPKNKVINIR
jgi:hypothetical protein